MGSQRREFWREAVALRGSVTLRTLARVISFGLIAGVICGVTWYVESVYQQRINIEVAPYEVAGAVLGSLLVLRTNAGYERWWEARELWGGIVNQSRNLVLGATAYGPADAGWRNRLIRWAAVLPHVVRLSLRSEKPGAAVVELVGPDSTAALAIADHMPSYAALRLAELLREGCDRHGLSGYVFLQLDRERALLIDHVGACERILKTPLPLAYSIIIRRFLVLFLLTLPFALLHRLDEEWLIPFITMLVAYPLLALDQIGVELENPFAVSNLNHLPLDELCATIERNVRAVGKLKDESA